MQKALKADGSPLNTPAANVGCTLQKAAQQSLKAISKEKYEAFIGNRDKGWLMWNLYRFFPNRVMRMILLQSKTQ